MNHLRSSLSKMSAVAVVMGLAACGGGQSQQAQAPSNTYAQPQPQASTSQDQYGSAMGQGTPGTGNEYGNPVGTPPGSADQYGNPQPAPGAGSQYGGGAAQNGQMPGQGAPGASQSMPGGSQYGAGTSPGMGMDQSGQNNPGITGGQTGSGSPSTIGAGQGSMGAAGSSMGGSMDVSSLNDAQLAAVLNAINQGEIQEAQIAQSRATAPEVKHLAQHLANAHQQIATKTQALFTRIQITPSDNSVSQQLQTDSQNELGALQGMRGRDFDRTFVDDQIKDHNQAIELIDRMIPNAKNPELKSELQTLRGRLENHLRDAERAQATLQKGAANPQPGGGGQQR